MIVLGEELTLGLLIGFPLVILGCWLAATGGRRACGSPRRPSPRILSASLRAARSADRLASPVDRPGAPVTWRARQWQRP